MKRPSDYYYYRLVVITNYVSHSFIPESSSYTFCFEQEPQYFDLAVAKCIQDHLDQFDSLIEKITPFLLKDTDYGSFFKDALDDKLPLERRFYLENDEALMKDVIKNMCDWDLAELLRFYEKSLVYSNSGIKMYLEPIENLIVINH